MDSLLDGEQSLMSARWVMPDVELSVIERIARTHDLPEAVARLLSARGVGIDDIPTYLNPTLKDNFPDPFSLSDMEATANYLAEAVQEKRSISIFGDFDVDGATSSSIMYRTLKHCGIDAPTYIPDRLTEGYGPNVEAFQSLKDQGTEIIILLDCGTTAFDTIQAGSDMGLEIVIVDHHEAEDKLPAAKYLINPKRKDDESGLDMMAAVGVTFMLCVALNTKLREVGFFEQNGIDEVPLKNWLDIVALGTVCDMVPLTDINRLLVKMGFKISTNTNNIGLQELKNVSGLEGAITSYSAGFVLGPRINAGSRVQQSDLGAKLLSTDDKDEANNIAWILNDCNDKRKDIQKSMETHAIQRVEREGLDQHAVIIIDDEEGHPGLSGLVAGRLKEKYKKPACVITYAEGEGRGSGRSIPGIHIAQAFIDARTEGLLINGGGHAMAGGFSLKPENLQAFKDFMIAHIAKQMESNEPQVETLIDGILTVCGTQPNFIHMLQNSVGPFGQDNPEPQFLFQNVRLIQADIVGGAHIRTMISDWEGGNRMKAMAFRAVDTPLGDALLQHSREAFHLLGVLKIDNWTGQERVEMHIRDAAFAVTDENRMVAS